MANPELNGDFAARHSRNQNRTQEPTFLRFAGCRTSGIPDARHKAGRYNSTPTSNRSILSIMSILSKKNSSSLFPNPATEYVSRKVRRKAAKKIRQSYFLRALAASRENLHFVFLCAPRRSLRLCVEMVSRFGHRRHKRKPSIVLRSGTIELLVKKKRFCRVVARIILEEALEETHMNTFAL